MRFACKNKALGCMQVLSYTEVQTHDDYCQFLPVKCQAFDKCKVKTLRKDIDLHQAACPNIVVPCIYCHE